MKLMRIRSCISLPLRFIQRVRLQSDPEKFRCFFHKMLIIWIWLMFFIRYTILQLPLYEKCALKGYAVPMGIKKEQETDITDYLTIGAATQAFLHQFCREQRVRKLWEKININYCSLIGSFCSNRVSPVKIFLSWRNYK